jgi:hypothetical protein
MSNLDVMDYSLIVGVDTSKKELVVGIIGEDILSQQSGLVWVTFHRVRFRQDLHLGQEA